MNRFPLTIKTITISAIAAGLALSAGSAFAGTPAQNAPQFAMTNTSTATIRASATAFKRGKYDDAVAFSRAAIKQGLKTSRRSAAYSNMCAALSASGDQIAALEACDEAVALNGENWQALSNRAVVLWQSGDEDKARRTDRRLAFVAAMVERYAEHLGEVPGALAALMAAEDGVFDAVLMRKLGVASQDAWGRPVGVEVDADTAISAVTSYGADGQPGGEKQAADIVSWQQ